MSEPVFVGAGWLRYGPVRTFQGRIVNGQCRLPFRLAGSNVQHVAVLDTGYAGMMLARHVAVSANLPLSMTDRVQVHGIGQGFKDVPTTRVDFTAEPAHGSVMRIKDKVPVDDLPVGCDMLFGTRVLAWGVFALDGPGGTWEWTVKDEDVDTAILMPS